jgi:hypothetical protein
MRGVVLKSFALGFALFVSTEVGWLVLRAGDPAISRWVLEPRDGIAAAVLAHFAGALLFAAILRPPLEGSLVFAAGVAAGLVVSLFLVGPGNLWPLALAFGTVLLAPAVAGGLLAGRVLPLRRKSPA